MMTKDTGYWTHDWTQDKGIGQDIKWWNKKGNADDADRADLKG